MWDQNPTVVSITREHPCRERLEIAMALQYQRTFIDYVKDWRDSVLFHLGSCVWVIRSKWSEPQLAVLADPPKRPDPCPPKKHSNAWMHRPEEDDAPLRRSISLPALREETNYLTEASCVGWRIFAPDSRRFLQDLAHDNNEWSDTSSFSQLVPGPNHDDHPAESPSDCQARLHQAVIDQYLDQLSQVAAGKDLRRWISSCSTSALKPDAHDMIEVGIPLTTAH